MEQNEQKYNDKMKSLKKEIKIEGKKGTLPLRFEPDISKGLSSKQVNIKILKGKVNYEPKQYSKTTLKIITSNVFTVFNLLCLICIIALAVVKAPPMNFLFCIPYATNLLIATVQEIKAKNSIEKLSIMNQATATVLRNGKLIEIGVNSIVEDDIINFSLGNQISADCTLLKGSIEVNESLLTGESVPVKKNVGDKLLAGSYVTGGKALAVADRVGEERYVEQLSLKAKKYKKPSSELLKSLQWIIRTVAVLILPVGLGVLYTNYRVILSLGREPFVSNGVLTSLGMTEIVSRTTSVIIGMIPAGMLLLTTLALAVGIIRLADKNTSVRDMYAVERLARVDVLCLDKTGTITDGRLKVNNCIIFEKDYKYSVSDIISSMQNALGDNNQTAIALQKHFGNEGKLIAKQKIAFSSDKKYSAVTLTDFKSVNATFALGAPEYVMPQSEENYKLYTYVRHYASMGQRVLLLAYSENEISSDTLPSDMKPFAIITLTDTIRKNAVKTIEWFKKNDVAVKVISGDNPVTVSEIAKRAGIEGANKYVSLEGLTDNEVINVANKYNVFGRVSPEQKAILVKALKSAGHTVAMTGDGVNDILAMKEADCSITVASGSDATKDIAHLVLMDNNFNSLPSVVEEGRRVINNIQRSSSLYLMKTLFTTIFAILSIIRGTVYPFNNQMMIMLETVIIAIGSFALSMEKNVTRVKKGFLSYVFASSIPGAIVLIMNVFVFDILDQLPLGIVIPPDYKDTLMVATLTFGGLIHLCIICKPYNTYRFILATSLTIVCVLWITCFMQMFNLPNFFDDLKSNWPYLFIILCLIQFDITVDRFFDLVTQKVKRI